MSVKPRLRREIFIRDEFICQECGASPHHGAQVFLEVDHIVPECRGGGNEASNLQTLCSQCNKGKGDLEPIERRDRPKPVAVAKERAQSPPAFPPGMPYRPAEYTRLTRRQLDVLSAVAAGASNTDIAKQLGVTRETVKTHIERAMAGLGARNRAHAVALAIEKNLLLPVNP